MSFDVTSLFIGVVIGIFSLIGILCLCMWFDNLIERKVDEACEECKEKKREKKK
ncbi:unnamed protein product [marine sediment metagenome]|uniref:Uncharacterized protein n=1 Tax=marine sediment metagenome TaxID=412755 RepID=X1F2Y0_9ZZZZ